MSTVNGFGTLRYGWKMNIDGTAVATYWFVAAFLPIIPLRRERIRIHSAYAGGGPQVPFVMASGFETRIEVIERLRLNWFSVLTTYLKAYLTLQR